MNNAKKQESNRMGKARDLIRYDSACMRHIGQPKSQRDSETVSRGRERLTLCPLPFAQSPGLPGGSTGGGGATPGGGPLVCHHH